MVKKNLLKALIVVSGILSSGAVIHATTYQQLTNLPAQVDLFAGDEGLKKLIDQVLSVGDNAGNLFKAYHFAVNLDKKAAQAAKAKGPNKIDLGNPAVAAYTMIKGIVGLLDKVRTSPQVANNIVDVCFSGDRNSDGSIIRGFLSYQGDDVQGYLANVITSQAVLEKFRREIAVFTRNLASSLSTTYAKWKIWEDNYVKMEQKASGRSSQNEQQQVASVQG